MELKFVAKAGLMEKLEPSFKGLHFYEATYDTVYGCGFSLADADKIWSGSVENKETLLRNF